MENQFTIIEKNPFVYIVNDNKLKQEVARFTTEDGAVLFTLTRERKLVAAIIANNRMDYLLERFSTIQAYDYIERFVDSIVMEQRHIDWGEFIINPLSYGYENSTDWEDAVLELFDKKDEGQKVLSSLEYTSFNTRRESA